MQKLITAFYKGEGVLNRNIWLDNFICIALSPSHIATYRLSSSTSINLCISIWCWCTPAEDLVLQIPLHISVNFSSSRTITVHRKQGRHWGKKAPWFVVQLTENSGMAGQDFTLSPSVTNRLALLSFSLTDICLHQANRCTHPEVYRSWDSYAALLGFFSAFIQFIKIINTVILKSTTSLVEKLSHHPGSILPKKALHISSSHELKQNEARQSL